MSALQCSTIQDRSCHSSKLTPARSYRGQARLQFVVSRSFRHRRSMRASPETMQRTQARRRRLVVAMSAFGQKNYDKCVIARPGPKRDLRKYLHRRIQKNQTQRHHSVYRTKPTSRLAAGRRGGAEGGSPGMRCPLPPSTIMSEGSSPVVDITFRWPILSAMMGGK
jgi:hypothetical protein